MVGKYHLWKGIVMFKKYYCVKQHDTTDCGAACIATISKQYNLRLSITKIRQMAGTDKNGTNAYGLVKAMEDLGFHAKGVRGDKESLFSEFPLPAIAHMVVDGSLLHYVVIHKISTKEILVADPGKGMTKYQPEEFLEQWTGVLIIATPRNDFSSGNHTKNIYQRFFGLIKPYRSLLLNIFLVSLLYTLFGIFGAFYFKVLVDDVLKYNLMKTLHILSIGVILLHLFQILMGAFRAHMLLYLSQKIDIPLILGYYNHVMNLPMNFFGTRKTGEIISRFMDASKIREAISGATLTIMIDTLMAIAGGIILYAQNSFLFGIAFVMLVMYFAVVTAFNKPIKRVNQQEMEESALLTSYLVESINGIETVKSMGAEREVETKTEFKFIKLLKTIFCAGKIYNLQSSLTGFISSIGGIVILWVGAYQVIKGELSVGQLLVFNSLLVYFISPVKNLINLQPMMQTAIVASDRLGEIMDLELEKSKAEQTYLSVDTLKGDIVFRNVDFRYGTRDKVLEGINIDIKKGERIAFVGESGSGKTTLSKLLMRFYEPEQGEILINDNNIKDIGMESLRARIAYVSQDVFLFSGTIKENLCLGNLEIDFGEMIEAAKRSSSHEFINQLPLRYDTQLEENGTNLSGGQRQRLSIARALLKKPDILIMDEATSNLDSMTEKAVEKMVEEMDEEVTTIVIAHRLSTIMRCDRIYVMAKGKIVEQGTHQELIQQKGRYFDMWKEQLPEFSR